MNEKETLLDLIERSDHSTFITKHFYSTYVKSKKEIKELVGPSDLVYYRGVSDDVDKPHFVVYTPRGYFRVYIEKSKPTRVYRVHRLRREIDPMDQAKDVRVTETNQRVLDWQKERGLNI